ncbi:hypothetical protein E4U32_007543 [Claviceps aff. humidiphila group G2b]|nr:hypothetical protein E4U32_007543 [Claviceps aff. humidiphila group G2b]
MEYHELDPNGDIILTLRHQNLQSFPGTIEVADSQVIEWTASGPGDLDSVRFRLSSKHLIRASPVFKAMITGPWKESLAFAAAVAKNSAEIPDEDALPEITTTGWDKKAFLLLLEILHGWHKHALPDVDACMLVNICVMVDYYQCHKAVAGFADAWIGCIMDTFPLSYG